MNKFQKVSNSVIKRLPRYHRFLTSLKSSGVEKISSGALAKKMHLTASQIRQDLNYFGGFGQQGYGYNIENLIAEIGKILCLEDTKNIILIGAGSLGTTIASQIDFKGFGFHLINIFDSNPDLIGKKISSVEIHDIDCLNDTSYLEHCESAILCIPKFSAEKICPKLISLGIVNFWNFSQYDLQLDFAGINVENIHLSDSLMQLSYRIGENKTRKN